MNENKMKRKEREKSDNKIFVLINTRIYIIHKCDDDKVIKWQNKQSDGE